MQFLHISQMRFWHRFVRSGPEYLQIQMKYFVLYEEVVLSIYSAS